MLTKPRGNPMFKELGQYLLLAVMMIVIAALMAGVGSSSDAADLFPAHGFTG